ncbi:hypothetical protein [Enterococcus sp. LJL51]|uniref:hypothetical protein n=1 Tax=Enterococcus sp. LJL51 TaxID=3416656 RepID=UPI003CE8863A
MNMKKVFFSSAAAVALFTVGLGVAGTANETYVSIPNEDVKNSVLSVLEAGDPEGNEIITQEEVYNFSNYHYLPKRLLETSDVFDSFSIDVNEVKPKSSSLEGIEYISAESLQINAPLIDVTPLKEMQGVKSLSLEDQFADLGYTHGIKDLNVLKGWTELKDLYYVSGNMNGIEDVKEKLPLLDISALDEIASLESICIETAGSLPTIYLSEENNDYETTLPIILSHHFDGEEWSGYSNNPSFDQNSEMTKKSDRMKWENIEPGTEYLDIWIQIQPRGHYYIADLRIPIIWE